ncbi:LysE family translocator, partial [Laribacter hongkongensis]|uniref:LysE family translocator n=1 Tax=Laribacter hongkongensis TaxID=168471 RepID=UPI001EFC531A
NLVALAAGHRCGWYPAQRHVAGATLGFVLLLVLTGIGLQSVLLRWPALLLAVQWGGGLYFFWLAWQLVRDDGVLAVDETPVRPSLTAAAAMQWLNPKAWLAAVAGTGAYVAPAAPASLWLFAAVYAVVCYASIACWAGMGARLRQVLTRPQRVRWLNRGLALLLAGCAVGMLA